MRGEQKAELWRRWKDGQSLSDIGRALGKAPGSVHGFLEASGGIAPAIRVRGARALSGCEREEISRQVCAGKSLREIARRLNRAPSTISREIARNGGRWTYRAGAADSRAWAQTKRPKHCKLKLHSRLRHAVSQKLELDWSPEQISGWLRCTFPRDVTYGMPLVEKAFYLLLHRSTDPVCRHGPHQCHSLCSANASPLFRRFFPTRLPGGQLGRSGVVNFP